MTAEQTLRTEIKDIEVWLSREKDESTYKRDLKKRIELINWVSMNMKKPDVQICNRIESKINEILPSINKTYSIFESDRLHCELRILEWIFFQVCVIKKKVKIHLIIYLSNQDSKLKVKSWQQNKKQ